MQMTQKQFQLNQKQFAISTPISGDFSPFEAIADRIYDLRRFVSICFFLRMNPLRARNRRLYRFLA